jgi:serine/threonine-protein kinase RsbW
MLPNAIKLDAKTYKSKISEVQTASEHVLSFFSTLNLDQSETFAVRLCFEESFINSVKYGSRGNAKLPIKVELAFNEREVFIAVEDQGNGFNPDSLPDPTSDSNLEANSGRGVYLIHHLMDKVTYNKKGNRVEMIKAYQGATCI